MTKKDKDLISIIIPVHNERDNIVWHHKAILKELEKADYDYEIIYVDDGSADDSLKLIKQWASSSKKTHDISFSRNFGKEIALTAGLLEARGDASVMIDADGQHPINLLPQFIDKWRTGAKVVVGIRHSNKKEGFIKKYGSKVFYYFLNNISGQKMIPGATDYRLMDKSVVEAFKQFTERQRMTRGLVDWLGFKRDHINFHAPERKHGAASYTPKKLVTLAIRGIVSHSFFPLRLSIYMGLIITALVTLTGIIILVEQFLLGDPLNWSISGTALLALLILFLVGLMMVGQGGLSLYVENIYTETQSRPLFIIEDSDLSDLKKPKHS